MPTTLPTASDVHGTIAAMNRPGRAEIRKFGGSLMTLGVILWITYATALGDNGKRHFLPHWALFLAWGGLVTGAVIVIGTIFWPSRPRKD